MPSPSNIEIFLSPTEIRFANVVATDRQLENLDKDRDPEGRPEELGWLRHFEGACGECAVAQWAGVYWNGNLGKLKAADVGRWEVKATAKHNRRLLVQKPKLVMERAYILVTGIAPNLIIRGWAWGYEVGQEKYWDNPVGDRPAFFMPQDALRPMQKSKKEIVLGG